MNSKTKIIVLRAKKLMYLSVAIGLFVLFLILFVIMLRKKEKSEPLIPDVQPQITDTLPTALSQDLVIPSYIPGVYSTSLTIAKNPVNVTVTVSEDEILSVKLENLGEAIETMYPFLQPCFDSLASQICEKQSLDGIVFENENRNTTLVFLNAIRTSLEKACVTYDIKEGTP